MNTASKSSRKVNFGTRIEGHKRNKTDSLAQEADLVAEKAVSFIVVCVSSTGKLPPPNGPV